MLKKEIKAAIKRYDYVLKPALKKVVRPAKDSRFYSMPPKPVVEVPVVPRNGDALEDVVDAAGLARVNAICDPDVKAIVIKKIQAMAAVRNQLGFAQVHGIILAVRNARRVPKVKVSKSIQGKPMVFHEYTESEKVVVSFIKKIQQQTAMFETVKKSVDDSHKRKCICACAATDGAGLRDCGESTIDIKNSQRVIVVSNEVEDGGVITADVAPMLSVYAASIGLPIKHADVEAPFEAKPKCAGYVIKWIETALTALREKYTGKRVPSSNRAEYFGFAWYDDYKFGEVDLAEYYAGY